MLNNPLLIIIIASVASFTVGGLLIWVLTRKTNQAKEQAAQAKANFIIKDAESKAEVMLKDKELKAKERFYQLKSEHEKSISEKDKNMLAAEIRIKQKEAAVSQRMEQQQRKQTETDAIQQNLRTQFASGLYGIRFFYSFI